jgi:chloramphenicol-sensitive protein RarD
VGYGALPWIALVLSVSWGGYSLVKKRLNLGALETLSVETFFAFFPNLIYLIMIEKEGRATFGDSIGVSILLAGAGIATVAPLLLFNGSTTHTFEHDRYVAVHHANHHAFHRSYC